jgi:hypothetical protein
VQKKNRKLAREVAELDTQLDSQRDDLSKIKQRRDKLRSTAHKMKDASVYIDNPMLLQDMVHQRSVRDELHSDIEDLLVLCTCLPLRLLRAVHTLFDGAFNTWPHGSFKSILLHTITLNIWDFIALAMQNVKPSRSWTAWECGQQSRTEGTICSCKPDLTMPPRARAVFKPHMPVVWLFKANKSHV